MNVIIVAMMIFVYFSLDVFAGRCYFPLGTRTPVC